MPETNNGESVVKLLKLAYLQYAVIAAFFAFGCAADSTSAAPEAESAPGSSIRVGHVDMERLFHSYAKTGEFYEKAEEIQARFQEIEEDDFEQMTQLQGEFQLIQMELFQSFQDDVEKIAETVSKEKNLHLIAVEVLYQTDKTKLVDVTEDFMGTELFTEEHVHSESCGPECE
jgi:Skp family chaperone for outer membrane proteins